MLGREAGLTLHLYMLLDICTGDNEVMCRASDVERQVEDGSLGLNLLFVCGWSV